MTVTAELCEKIVAQTWDSLSQEAIVAARRLVLDGISIALAGTEEEAMRILGEHYRGFGARGDCTAIGHGFRTAPTLAAALNGASMHVLDFEPMWTPSNHALSTTLPAILALAETRDVSGRDLITALVKGIELQGWIRHAGHLYENGSIRFHPPALVGPMGSAVAAGHLLGLTPSQLAYALGMASSRCGGMAANIGTMTKSTHCGNAASSGLECAMLASRGFDANPEPFEAFNGYGKMMFGDTFEPRDLLNFGAPWRIVSPGYAVKMFPSQFGTHFAITAGLQLRPQIPARFDQIWIEADVEMQDGTMLHTRCNGPRGIWGSPPISAGDHLVKVRDCLSRRLPHDAAEKLIDLALKVDTLDAVGVRAMVALAC